MDSIASKLSVYITNESNSETVKSLANHSKLHSGRSPKHIFYSTLNPISAENVQKILDQRTSDPLQAAVNTSSHKDISDHMRLGKQKKGWTIYFNETQGNRYKKVIKSFYFTRRKFVFGVDQAPYRIQYMN